MEDDRTRSSPNVRWKPLTDDQLSLSIGGMALDPDRRDGQHAGRGLWTAQQFRRHGRRAKGLIRTTDGGTTWTRIGETALAGRSIYQIAVRGATFLLAVPSTDNGTAAGAVSHHRHRREFHEHVGRGGSGLPAGAVHASRRATRAIRRATTATSPTPACIAARIRARRGRAFPRAWRPPILGQVALAVSPNGTLFAAEITTTSRVYRSTNQGGNWTQMDSVTANTGGTLTASSADPSNSNLVYLSGLFMRATFPFSGRVVRGDASLAAGSQWTSIASTQRAGRAAPRRTRTRARMAFTAGNRLIECDDGGIYELNIANVGSEGNGTGGGGTWRSLNGDLRDTEMHSMAYDRVSRIFIGGAQDTGVPGTAVARTDRRGHGGLEKHLERRRRRRRHRFHHARPRASPSATAVRNISRLFPRDLRRQQQSRRQSRLSAPHAHRRRHGDRPAAPDGNMPFTTPLAMNAVAGGRLIISGNNNVYESLNQGNTVTQIDTGRGRTRSRKSPTAESSAASRSRALSFSARAATSAIARPQRRVTGNIAFPGGTVQGIVLDPENWKTRVHRRHDRGLFRERHPGEWRGAPSRTSPAISPASALFTRSNISRCPSGNAIFVGTDLGAYIMRLSCPGRVENAGR